MAKKSTSAQLMESLLNDNWHEFGPFFCKAFELKKEQKAQYFEECRDYLSYLEGYFNS